MYRPTAPEPEWIEITNRTIDSINLNSWKISDRNTGSKSALTPMEFDLAVQRIYFSPTAPIAGNEITINAAVFNKGKQETNNYSVKFYIDSNTDSILGVEPEWIELFNTTSDTIDLKNWKLSNRNSSLK